MGLSPSDLNEFRELLRQRAEELMAGAEHTRGDMHEEGALFADPVDRAMLESGRSFELRLRDRERKLIRKIREAIDRIDHGEYGLCESCGEPIERERLLARPVTTLCIECKEEQERLEKMQF